MSIPLSKKNTKSPIPRKAYLTQKAQPDFDDAYYRRFYLNPTTRVRAETGLKNLADFVFGYLSHLEMPINRVLDLGCGLGQWRQELRKHHPAATYQGVEISPYLCKKLGWAQSSVGEYKGRGTFDLVICQSVIQYLNDEDAEKAIANLARLCRGAVYLEIITHYDWQNNCDQKVTDGNVYLREGTWYRKRLEKYFRSAGGGLFLPKKSGAVLYELEGC